MITTIQLTNAAAKALGGVSDYRLAKELGIRATTISNWRNRGTVMDDETAEKAAELAGFDAGYVLACLAAERAKNKPTYPAWKRVAEGMERYILCSIEGVMGLPRMAA